MSRAQIDDAPFQSDLIALAAVGTTLLAAAYLDGGVALERTLALGQAASWSLFTLLTLHGLVVCVVLVHALIAPSTLALVERFGGKALLAYAIASLLQAAIIGLTMSRWSDTVAVFGWLGFGLVAIHLGWRSFALKRTGGGRPAVVQIIGVIALGFGFLLAAVAPRLEADGPGIAALAGAACASVGWIVVAIGSFLSLPRAVGGDDGTLPSKSDESPKQARFARLARLIAHLPRPRRGSWRRCLAAARVLVLVAATASLIHSWSQSDPATPWSAAWLVLTAIAVLAGLVLTVSAWLEWRAPHADPSGTTIVADTVERSGTVGPVDDVVQGELGDTGLTARTVPRRRNRAQKSARKRLNALPLQQLRTGQARSRPAVPE